MLDIGIMGAGVGGLSAGVMLRSIGCKVTIFEKLAESSSDGVGLQISANGIRALKMYGLQNKIAELGDYPDFIGCINGLTGKELAKIPLGKTAEKLYGAGFYQFHRADFISLLKRENFRLGVDIFYKTQVLEIKHDLNGATVTTSGGSSSRFDLIVAADGINSTTRNKIFQANTPVFLNQVAYRTVISADKLPKSFASRQTRLFLGAGKHVVSYPIRKGSLVNFVFCAEFDSYCQEIWTREINPQEIKEKFSEFIDLKEVLKNMDSVKKWGLFEHTSLDSWHRNRVVLLGDACHPILPYLAQGATQAIEDAHELCIRINKSFDNQNLEQELVKYAKNRIPRVRRVGRASRLNATLFHLRNPILVFIFHLSLRMLGIICPKYLLRRFSWIYAGGPA